MTRFGDDTRAASIAITHAMTIGISALLITTLLFSAGSMFERQEERVIRSGLLDVGDSVTDELVQLDRIVTDGVGSDINTTVEYPDRIGGQSYSLRLSVAPSGVATLYTNATERAISVPTNVTTRTSVCEAYKNSGPIRIYYDFDRDCLTIGSVGR